ncbi:hypothetical protein FRC09_019063, partial [Ceratobasidium sp. 395]
MGGERSDDSTLPSPITPTVAPQTTSDQTGLLNSSNSRPPAIDTSTANGETFTRPSVVTVATSSTVDSFVSAASTPVSARPDRPSRLPPPVPTELPSDLPPPVPSKDHLAISISPTNGAHGGYGTGGKSSTGRVVTHNLDSPADMYTLTPLRAHYLKKTLISMEFSEELKIITTQPANNSVSTLSYLGAPFTALPREVPRQDLPFLRFMFRQFALTFPFLAAAPKDFFPNKFQPFIASVVARNLSSATNLLEAEEAQTSDGQQILNKAEKHLALLLGAAMKLTENEEVVRLSQADLARIERAAEKRRRKAAASARGVARAEIFDVNVIAVRAVTDKGRVRSKVHEEFVIRTRRTGQPDVFVSRRYGDFKSLSDELRKHHPMEEIRPPPAKDRSQVVVTSPTNSAFSIRSYLYGSATPTSPAGPSSPVPTNESSDTIGSPTAASTQSQSLSREKNRLTLRGYLHGLLSHSSAIASSPVLRSFLLSGPIRMTEEERRDAERREEADRVREESKKKFAEEITARVEALRGAVRGVRGDMMGA